MYFFKTVFGLSARDGFFMACRVFSPSIQFPTFAGTEDLQRSPGRHDSSLHIMTLTE